MAGPRCSWKLRESASLRAKQTSLGGSNPSKAEMPLQPLRAVYCITRQVDIFQSKRSSFLEVEQELLFFGGLNFWPCQTRHYGWTVIQEIFTVILKANFELQRHLTWCLMHSARAHQLKRVDGCVRSSVYMWVSHSFALNYRSWY